MGSAKAGPDALPSPLPRELAEAPPARSRLWPRAVSRGLRCCRNRRDRRRLVAGVGPRAVSREPPRAARTSGSAARLVAGFGQEPSPRESSTIANASRYASAGGEATGPHERPHSTRQQDGGDHRRAPKSVRETTGGHRPCDQGEAHDRDRQDRRTTTLAPQSQSTRRRGALSRTARRLSGRRRPSARSKPPGSRTATTGRSPTRRGGPAEHRNEQWHRAPRQGATNRSSHCSITITTPGHSRSGFLAEFVILCTGVLFSTTDRHQLIDVLL